MQTYTDLFLCLAMYILATACLLGIGWITCLLTA